MRILVTSVPVMLLWVAVTPAPLAAYTGPGVGLAVVGVVVGFIFSIFVAIFGVVWLPIKRLWKKIRGERGAPTEAEAPQTPADDMEA